MTMHSRIWQGKQSTCYSPSIGQSSIIPYHAPSDNHFYPQLKKHLGGHKFHSNDKIQVEIQKIFSSQDPQFYATNTEKLVLRYDKCLNNLSDYVENKES